MGKDVIIAWDFSNKDDVMEFLSKFSGESLYLKIGMELYYGEGPEIIKNDELIHEYAKLRLKSC